MFCWVLTCGVIATLQSREALEGGDSWAFFFGSLLATEVEVRDLGFSDQGSGTHVVGNARMYDIGKLTRRCGKHLTQHTPVAYGAFLKLYLKGQRD